MGFVSICILAINNGMDDASLLRDGLFDYGLWK